MRGGRLWLEQRACRDVPTDVFFPELPGIATDWSVPRAICRGCPVRQQCLDEALETDSNHPEGMRGGIQPDQRRRLRQQRRRLSA